jgi:hypothetical protein
MTTVDNWTNYFMKYFISWITQQLRYIKDKDLNNELSNIANVNNIVKRLSSSNTMENDYIKNIEDISMIFFKEEYQNSLNIVKAEIDALASDISYTKHIIKDLKD